jgi:cytochrome c553
MSKLVVLILVLFSFVSILFLDGFKRLKPVNTPISYETQKKEHEEKLNLIAKIEEAKTGDSQVEEVKVEVPAFKVELTTEGLKRGHELYSKCIVCHGPMGEGKKSQNAPKIGGQYDWYITAQLKKMKSQERVNAVMNPYIAKLSDQDFSDLGEYVSKFPW